MFYKNIKDKKLRQILNQKESSLLLKKFVFIKMLQKNKTKAVIFLSSNSFKKFSRVKIRRRCIYTNRSRSVLTKYNISRIKLREMLSFGYLPGYKKSV